MDTRTDEHEPVDLSATLVRHRETMRGTSFTGQLYTVVRVAIVVFVLFLKFRWMNWRESRRNPPPTD